MASIFSYDYQIFDRHEFHPIDPSEANNQTSITIVTIMFFINLNYAITNYFFSSLYVCNYLNTEYLINITIQFPL